MAPLVRCLLNMSIRIVVETPLHSSHEYPSASNLFSPAFFASFVLAAALRVSRDVFLSLCYKNAYCTEIALSD